MKNLRFLALFVAILFMSCSTSKIAAEKEKTMRGDWTLSEITTDQGNLVDVKQIFNRPFKCMEGSDWHLVANNNTGWFVQSANCATNQNRIKWYMQEEGTDVYFWFKQIAEGQKDKKVLTGYKMKLVSIDDANANFMHEVPFEDGKMTFYYHFTKK